jgi:lysophospholipase L1-like esterase
VKLALAALLCLSALVPASEALADEPRPHPALRPKPRRAVWWYKKHERINREVRLAGRKAQLIFVGDSITEGWRLDGKAVWPRRYARRHALNLGLGGDQTGHLLWRLGHGNLTGLSPRLAVVLIGVNNAFSRAHSARDIAAGIGAVVRKLRSQLPRTQVLVLGVFPCGQTSKGRLRGKVTAINTLAAKLADGKRVHYLDIGERFLQKNGSISQEVMYDYLHLTERGYRIWARALEPSLRRLMGTK